MKVLQLQLRFNECFSSLTFSGSMELAQAFWHFESYCIVNSVIHDQRFCILQTEILQMRIEKKIPLWLFFFLVCNKMEILPWKYCRSEKVHRMNFQRLQIFVDKIRISTAIRDLPPPPFFQRLRFANESTLSENSTRKYPYLFSKMSIFWGIWKFSNVQTVFFGCAAKFSSRVQVTLLSCCNIGSSAL